MFHEGQICHMSYPHPSPRLQKIPPPPLEETMGTPPMGSEGISEEHSLLIDLSQIKSVLFVNGDVHFERPLSVLGIHGIPASFLPAIICSMETHIFLAESWHQFRIRTKDIAL